MEFFRDAAGCVSHFVDGMWMFVVPWLALCRDCVGGRLSWMVVQQVLHYVGLLRCSCNITNVPYPSMEFCRDAAGCVSHFVDGMWMFVVPWLALCRDCVGGWLSWTVVQQVLHYVGLLLQHNSRAISQYGIF